MNVKDVMDALGDEGRIDIQVTRRDVGSPEIIVDVEWWLDLGPGADGRRYREGRTFAHPSIEVALEAAMARAQEVREQDREQRVADLLSEVSERLGHIRLLVSGK